MPRLNQFPDCPICGQAGLEVTVNHRFGYKGIILGCRCRFLEWMTPQYDRAGIEEFYRRRYRLQRRETNDRRRILGDTIRSRSQLKFWRSYVPRESRVLEIGAGFGTNALNLIFSGYNNLLISEWDSKHLDPRLADLGSKNQCLETMAPASFDFIIMSHVLEHFGDIVSGIEQLARILRPAGKIFIEVPNNLNPYVRQLMPESYHYYFFTPASLAALFRACGFRVLELETFGKQELIGQLDQAGWEAYRLKAEADPDFDDIVALPPDDQGAYWIRAIFQKRANRSGAQDE